jgi:hypothetical protein
LTALPLPRRRQAAHNRTLAGFGPPFIGEETMLTPAQRHFQRVMAERHGKAMICQKQRVLRTSKFCTACVWI